MSGVLVVSISLGGAVLLLLVMVALARRLERRRGLEVLAGFRGRRVLGMTSNANFFGRESQGPGQLRGNGVLVLTPETLYFEMWAPRRAHEIPVAAIREVGIRKSHLGKTRFRPLLHVTFTDERGREDSSAWLLRDVETWRAALEKLAVEQVGRLPGEADRRVGRSSEARR
ncbi:MAG: hypothetical protein R6V85_05435 [Polyangia bacterium]